MLIDHTGEALLVADVVSLSSDSESSSFPSTSRTIETGLRVDLDESFVFPTGRTLSLETSGLVLSRVNDRRKGGGLALRSGR